MTCTPRCAIISGGPGATRGNVPLVFDEVLIAVEKAVESLPRPPVRRAPRIARATDPAGQPANLAQSAIGAVPELARALTVALAYEEGADDLQALLSELPLVGKELEEARKLWRRSEAGRPGPDRVVAWLRGVRSFVTVVGSGRSLPGPDRGTRDSTFGDDIGRGPDRAVQG